MRGGSLLPFLPRPIISIFPLPQSLAPHNAALARSHGAELSAGAALPVPRTDAGSEGSRIPKASVAGWTLCCSLGEPVCPLLPAFPPAFGQLLAPQRWAGVWGTLLGRQHRPDVCGVTGAATQGLLSLPQFPHLQQG